MLRTCGATDASAMNRPWLSTASRCPPAVVNRFRLSALWNQGRDRYTTSGVDARHTDRASSTTYTRFLNVFIHIIAPVVHRRPTPETPTTRAWSNFLTKEGSLPVHGHGNMVMRVPSLLVAPCRTSVTSGYCFSRSQIVCPLFPRAHTPGFHHDSGNACVSPHCPISKFSKPSLRAGDSGRTR